MDFTEMCRERTGHTPEALAEALRAHGPISALMGSAFLSAYWHWQGIDLEYGRALAAARRALHEQGDAGKGEMRASNLNGVLQNYGLRVDILSARCEDARNRLTGMLSQAAETLTLPEVNASARKELAELVAAFRAAHQDVRDSEHDDAHALADAVEALLLGERT
ncbi:hypothetical protein AB0K18_43215 [Nonomuraea sp. NPDC049421]|uniref:hypothetical protein n=1 Tax=Nonomuraea sp. NPDC049421 TaxID=3155275 RepID=UPI00342DAB09